MAVKTTTTTTTNTLDSSEDKINVIFKLNQYANLSMLYSHRKLE